MQPEAQSRVEPRIELDSIRREPSRVGFTRAYELIRRFLRCYAVNTIRPTNPSMSAILNNSLFSPRSERSGRERLPAASAAFVEKQLINFEHRNFFYERVGLCVRGDKCGV